MIAMFLGGGIAGVALASALAPDVPLARFFGLCALPLAFIAGAHLWLGFALIRGMLLVVKRRALPSFARSGAIPPGAIAFVFTSLGISIPLGFLIAIAPNRLGFAPTLAVFVVLGAGYGITCYLLARNGYLPVYDLESE